jgi:hypothetical protein
MHERGKLVGVEVARGVNENERVCRREPPEFEVTRDDDASRAQLRLRQSNELGEPFPVCALRVERSRARASAAKPAEAKEKGQNRQRETSRAAPPIGAAGLRELGAHARAAANPANAPDAAIAGSASKASNRTGVGDIESMTSLSVDVKMTPRTNEARSNVGSVSARVTRVRNVRKVGAGHDTGVIVGAPQRASRKS